jgi:hypothetical protein
MLKTHLDLQEDPGIYRLDPGDGKLRTTQYENVTYLGVTGGEHCFTIWPVTGGSQSWRYNSEEVDALILQGKLTES